jgi:ADP-ribosyl-[dinitrogen reductase] hydrolase
MARGSKLGLLFGGLVGDAFGSRYEFKSSKQTKGELVKDNFQIELKGGGPFKLEPGQITDDSELALTLLDAIRENGGKYSQSMVAQGYIRWFRSNPVDIGSTISNALEGASTFGEVISNAKSNIESLSNGCLMRIWSLLYYYHSKPDYEQNRAVIDDCILTHPNNECIKICILYCSILRAAMLPSTSKGDIMKLVLEASINMRSPIIESVYDTVMNNRATVKLLNGEEVKLDGTKCIGYIGLSFAIALREFMQSDGNMVKFMSNISSYGGDTDTNCCIAGALFGAYYGIQAISDRWIQQILELKCERYSDYPIIEVALLKI